MFAPDVFFCSKRLSIQLSLSIDILFILFILFISPFIIFSVNRSLIDQPISALSMGIDILLLSDVTQFFAMFVKLCFIIAFIIDIFGILERSFFSVVPIACPPSFSACFSPSPVCNVVLNVLNPTPPSLMVLDIPQAVTKSKPNFRIALSAHINSATFSPFCVLLSRNSVPTKKRSIIVSSSHKKVLASPPPSIDPTVKAALIPAVPPCHFVAHTTARPPHNLHNSFIICPYASVSISSFIFAILSCVFSIRSSLTMCVNCLF